MKVTEIFQSIQGESTQAGRRCVFVRLTGCDLRCRWCDTQYAYTGGRSMTLDEIVSAVGAYRCSLALITGGEPLLQPETPELCRRLLAEGFEVMLETAGHRDISSVPPEVRVVLDVKCPGSGESDRMDLANLDRLSPRGEVKFVLAGRADYEWARRLVAERGLTSRFPVLFAPVFGELAYEDLASWMLDDGLDVRFQIQLHKHIWDPRRRGV